MIMITTMIIINYSTPLLHRINKTVSKSLNTSGRNILPAIENNHSIVALEAGICLDIFLDAFSRWCIRHEVEFLT